MVVVSEKTQRLAARCLEDIVVYDYQVASKAALPYWMRTKFNQTLQLQKEAAQDANEAMEELESRVHNLERTVLSRAEMK